jgi:iron complex transport system substrate-binding protein
MVYALGAGGQLVGRSHECDYPPEVVDLPIVSRPALDLLDASPAEIDQAVSGRMFAGASMYAIDEVLLRDLRPDVILTQNLCRVCAPSGNELSRAVRDFAIRPDILFLTPADIAGIEENIQATGVAIGRPDAAGELIHATRKRVARIRAAVVAAPARRVAFLEWTDPLFCAGHWVPEMIALAGGHDPLGRPGEDSVRVGWEHVEAAAPELIVVSPCGYRLPQAAEFARSLPRLSGARVYAVDANAYYARPGPRVAEGVELLGHLFHPGLIPWTHAHKPWAEII